MTDVAENPASTELYDGVEGWLVALGTRRLDQHIPLGRVRCVRCGGVWRGKSRVPWAHTEQDVRCVARRNYMHAKNRLGMMELQRQVHGTWLEQAGWLVHWTDSAVERPRGYCAAAEIQGKMFRMCPEHTVRKAWASPEAAELVQVVIGVGITKNQRSRLLEAAMYDPSVVQAAKTCMRLAEHGRWDPTYRAALRDLGDRLKIK